MTTEKLASLVLATCDAGRFLHVGCGDGSLVRHLLKLGCDACGFDGSADVAARAATLTPSRFRSGSLCNLPYDADSFDTIIVGECLADFDSDRLTEALRELLRVSRANVFAHLDLDRLPGGFAGRGDRAWWESRFFAAGFRKHPSYYVANPYEALERDDRRILIPLEKIPRDAAAAYSLESLRAERDLHMDMLRETGRRSDAHVMRYVLAAGLVRSGDIVLDAACGMGYGSHVLRRLTKASMVIGVDIAQKALDYAKANFEHAARGIEFRPGSAEDLGFLPDHSVDAVASFETLEHIESPSRFLAEARRVLRPGGRIIVSVPNRWIDATGTDPNPHHLHVYDWKTLHAQLQEHFLIEKAYQQTAGNGFILSDRPRRLREVDVNARPEMESEWWIMVGSLDPTDGSTIPYKEIFYPYSHPPENLLAFARDYRNPWLVRSLVEYPTRALSGAVLARIADKTLQISDPLSCDQGAGLCVLGYRLLDDDGTGCGDMESLLGRIQTYLDAAPGNAHQLRWRISLAFLKGQILLKLGHLIEAEQAFAACSRMDCVPFSPTLGTKTVAAHFIAGWLAHGRADTPRARRHWTSGIQEAKRLLQSDWVEFVGIEDNPLAFPLVTAVEFLDTAVMCANALRCTSGDPRHPPANLWTEANHCWKTMINERWRAMRDMEIMIRDRDETIVAQAAMLEQRWRAMQRMEAVARDHKEALTAQAKMLDERWDTIQRMEAMIHDRDEAIAAQAALVEQRWQAIQRMEAMIRDRDEAIQRMEAMIRDRDEAIAAQTKMLDERWDIMQQMEGMIRDRDQAIDTLEKKLAQQQQQGQRTDQKRGPPR